MKKVTLVELTFENIDWIRIPVKYVSRLRIENIQKNLFVNQTGEISDELRVEYVSFRIDPSIEKKSAGFAGDWCHFSEVRPFLQRLQHNDIVTVELHFDDKSIDKFTVQWKEEPDNEFRNQYQRVQLEEDGSYSVSICNPARLEIYE